MFKELNPLLHSELRLAVMSVLIGVESADFVFLRQQTGATAGNLSVQLDKLAKAGYIDVEKASAARCPAPSAASPTPDATPSRSMSRRCKATSNDRLPDREPAVSSARRRQSVQKKVTRNGTLKSMTQPWKIDTTA